MSVLRRDPVPWHVIAVITAAVVAIGAASVLVRTADATPVAIALARSVGVAVIFAPGMRRVSAADAARIGLAGAALAAHFVVWFISIDHTTILRSTVLVTLSPAWVAGLEWLSLGQVPSKRFLPGVLLAAAGASVMVTDAGQPSAYGDGMAFLGGVFASVYLVLARSLRARVGLPTTAGLVGAAAALCLLPPALCQGLPLVPWTPTTWACVVGLIVGPQVIGHGGMTYALRWVPASSISAITLLEPVGAAALAATLLGERPTAQAFAGSLIALLGVAAALGPYGSKTNGGRGGVHPSPSTST